MLLCFFSLLTSMFANIAEQQKEVGVLLAIGLECVAAPPDFSHPWRAHATTLLLVSFRTRAPLTLTSDPAAPSAGRSGRACNSSLHPTPYP
jgi:hypothetical protein